MITELDVRVMTAAEIREMSSKKPKGLSGAS